MLTLLFDAGYVTIVVVGTLKSALSFFISAVVHELQLVQEFSCTPNPAVEEIGALRAPAQAEWISPHHRKLTVPFARTSSFSDVSYPLHFAGNGKMRVRTVTEIRPV